MSTWHPETKMGVEQEIESSTKKVGGIRASRLTSYFNYLQLPDPILLSLSIVIV